MVVIHCLRRSFSTAPALASEDTGKGVNVGKASEMGFMRRWPVPPAPGAAVVMRGTAAERGAKKGLKSILLFAPGRPGENYHKLNIILPTVL